jgi:phenylalanyl-tRNA synthetase alpha chain
MDKYGPPLRAAYPGRCFRNEAVDASHEHTFDQFEALVVDTDINIGHCIGVIKELLNGLYEQEVEVRVRPGYFPFTEPSFEMDMSCILCGGEGCSVCEHIGWVEMLGAGLVHQNVIDKAGYDSDKWSGLAFGMGLTRLAMMKYGIEDIRHFNSGDLRFLNQF